MGVLWGCVSFPTPTTSVVLVITPLGLGVELVVWGSALPRDFLMMELFHPCTVLQ